MLLKAHNFTPSVYYNESRDFQFIGRLFDVVLNSVKTNVDMLYNIPLSENSDDRLLSLMMLTLGFKPRHQYNNRQLKAFCMAFTQAIRNKGSLRAFEIAVNALANSEGIRDGIIGVTIASDATDAPMLTISLPQDFKGTTLLRDIMDYLLPAGISYQLITQTAISFANTPTTEVYISNDQVDLSFDNLALDWAQIVDEADAEVALYDDPATGQQLADVTAGSIAYGLVISNIDSEIQPEASIAFQSSLVNDSVQQSSKAYKALVASNAEKTEVSEGEHDAE